MKEITFNKSQVLRVLSNERRDITNNKFDYEQPLESFKKGYRDLAPEKRSILKFLFLCK